MNFQEWTSSLGNHSISVTFELRRLYEGLHCQLQSCSPVVWPEVLASVSHLHQSSIKLHSSDWSVRPKKASQPIMYYFIHRDTLKEAAETSPCLLLYL